VVNTISLERLKLSHSQKTEALIGKISLAVDVFSTSVLATSAELGVSEENVLARSKFWSETYMDYAQRDWVKHNNIYRGFVGDDLKTCTKAYPTFVKLIPKYAEKLN
jgi:hypothetical protein